MSNNWGNELAYFLSDSPNDGDLPFPEHLWTLKTTPTGFGGDIYISSAHVEASIFYSSIGDGSTNIAGMTECQQYNNYVYLARTLSSSLGYVVPEYDTECSSERISGAETVKTTSLFPSGLAYAYIPRIGGGPRPELLRTPQSPLQLLPLRGLLQTLLSRLLVPAPAGVL